MKYIVSSLLLLFVLNSFSQSKKSVDSLKLAFSKPEFEFYSDNSGCFGQQSMEYSFVKEHGKIIVTYQADHKTIVKRISKANYNKFIKLYTAGYKKFKGNDVKQTCTSVSEFIITNRHTHPLSFKNVTCEADLNPEFFLQKILKQ